MPKKNDSNYKRKDAINYDENEVEQKWSREQMPTKLGAPESIPQASDEAYQWLKSQQDVDDNGFIQSFEDYWEDGVPKQVAYIYDQAVASIAFLVRGDRSRADTILDYMLKVQEKDGSWINSYWSNNDPSGNIYGEQLIKNIGPISWVTLAVMAREKITQDTTSEKAIGYHQMAIKALDWCLKFKQENGGIAGGQILIGHNQFINETFSSTEHNLDMYAALKYFGNTSPEKKVEYEGAMKGIEYFLDNVIWDEQRGTFYGGFKNDTQEIDPRTPLDVSPWSVLVLGDEKRCKEAIKYVENVHGDPKNHIGTLEYPRFKYTLEQNDQKITGYNFDWESDGKPNTRPYCGDGLRSADIWFEGTAFMSLAYYRLGNTKKADKIITEIMKAQGVNGTKVGGIPYSLNGTNNNYWNMSNRNCVSSTGWFIMAVHRFNPFEGETILQKTKAGTEKIIKAEEELPNEAILNKELPKMAGSNLLQASVYDNLTPLPVPSAPQVERNSLTPRVLTLDGGGTCGVVTLMYLKKLEAEANNMERKNRKLAERFDMIAGTSSGAIIAAALAIGLSAEKCSEVFNRCVKEVFSNSSLRKISTLYGITSNMYDTKKLKKILGEYGIHEDIKLSDFKGKARVCTLAFDTKTGRPILHDSADPNTAISLVDAVLASAAAPGYFPMGKNGEIDGAVAAKNPTALVWENVCGSLPAFVVSVGTGRFPLPTINSENGGLSNLGFKLPEFILDNEVATAHRYMIQKSHEIPDLSYFRWDPPMEKTVPMDAKFRELQEVKRRAEESIQSSLPTIKNIANSLVEGTEATLTRKLYGDTKKDIAGEFTLVSSEKSDRPNIDTGSVEDWIRISDSFQKNPYGLATYLRNFLRNNQKIVALCDFAKDTGLKNVEELHRELLKFEEKLNKWDSYLGEDNASEERFSVIMKAHENISNRILNPIQVLRQIIQSYNEPEFSEASRQKYISWLFENEYNRELYEKLLDKDYDSLRETWKRCEDWGKKLNNPKLDLHLKEAYIGNLLSNLQYLEELAKGKYLDYKGNTGLEEHFESTSSAKKMPTVATTRHAEIKVSRESMGEDFSEHMFYITQSHAKKNMLPQKQFKEPYVLKDIEGKPCVGFLNIPIESRGRQEYENISNASQNTYRHAATREVVGKIMKGYIEPIVSIVDNRKEHEVRLLLAGSGNIRDLKNNPALDFIQHLENIDAAMKNAFGENILTQKGKIKNSGKNFREISYDVWNPKIGNTKTLTIRVQGFIDGDNSIDPYKKESVQVAMDNFKPHAVMNLASSFTNPYYKIETKAGDGKLSKVPSMHHDPNKAKASEILGDNLSCVKALENSLKPVLHSKFVLTNHPILPVKEVYY